MNWCLIPHSHKETSTDATKPNSSIIHLKLQQPTTLTIGRIELIQATAQACAGLCSSCTNIRKCAPFISKSLLTFRKDYLKSGRESCLLLLKKKHGRMIRINNETPRTEEVILSDGDSISILVPTLDFIHENGDHPPAKRVGREIMNFTFREEPKKINQFPTKKKIGNVEAECSQEESTESPYSESDSPMLSMPTFFNASSNSFDSVNNISYTSLSFTQSNSFAEKQNTSIHTSGTTHDTNRTLENSSMEDLIQFKNSLPNDEKCEWKRLILNIALQKKKEGRTSPIPDLFRNAKI